MATKKKEKNSECLEDEDRFYYNDDSDVQEVFESLRSNGNRFPNSDEYDSY